MTTTRIQEKLSKIVSDQLPDFIQQDYVTFQAFLQAYYEFIEQDQQSQELIQNALSYNNVDTTINSFVEYFLKQYCSNIPPTVLADKRLLVKRVQDLYRNIGNSKGFSLLFRILFNKEANLFYPHTQVLKTSDGKWIQDTYVYIKTIYGNPSNLVNNTATISAPDSSTNYNIYFKEKNDVLVKSGSSLVTSSDTFKYIIDNRRNPPINIGDIVVRDNFYGEVVATPVFGKVTNEGQGFKVGDVFIVEDVLGYGLKFKVTKVGSNGQLKNIQILDYGINYLDNFYVYVSTQTSSALSPYSYSGGTLTLSDRTSGFVDEGYINTHDYTDGDYSDITYSGLIRAVFQNDSSSLTGDTDFDAVIFFTLGGKAVSPGYYETNFGFLSDEIYLQDDKVYIPFSYVINVEERLQDYKKAVLDILHPAGTNIIGNLTLTNNLDISTTLSTDVKTLNQNYQDTVSTLSAMVISFTKFLDDNVILSDTLNKNITKPLVDDVSTSDLISKTSTKILSDNLALTDTASLTANKNIEELILNEDSLTFSFTKSLDENTQAIESISKSLDKYLEDNNSVSDNGYIIPNPYVEEGYFFGVYVGTPVNF